MSDVVTMRYDPNFTTDTMRIWSDQDFPFVTERNLEFMKNKLYDYSVYGSREQTAKLTKEFQAAKASRNLAKRFDKMLSQKSPSTTLSRQDNSAFTLTRNPAKTRT